jgi:hypothetical protein
MRTRRERPRRRRAAQTTDEISTSEQTAQHVFSTLPVSVTQGHNEQMFSGLPEGRLRPRKGVLSALRFRRGASRCASLADLYCAFGMAFLRCCYHQILGPRRHLPKFSNVFADTPVPTSASTRILAGKPLRAMSSAAMLLHLYRDIRSSLIALSGTAEQLMKSCRFN